ncbi:MAG: CYTH domain-containing protein [Caulobacter sp.]|nr:CYTH domain-containing protein [Caulobacter sp.]
MTTPTREIELKFLLDAAAAAAVLTALPQGETMVKDMVATYFDTADHWLRRHGFGLRVRRSGGERIQTLKAGIERDGGRDEWEWPVEADTPDPALLAGTPAALPAGAALVPLFTVTSRRTLRMVQAEGALIELVIDDARVEAGDRTDVFLELELELKAGEAAALETLAARLSAVAALTPTDLTKAGRGFRLLPPQAKI